MCINKYVLFENFLITDNPDLEYLYFISFNMMRQVVYSPEAKSAYNYYFCCKPTWDQGHGGQVFHESLTMTAYAM